MPTNPERDPEDPSGAEHPKIATEFSRNLTLLQITMMGVGMMIGAGVFLGVGNAVRVAGPGGVILTFALNAVIALFTAMSYAELSSAVPRAGGAYNFARIAFGRGTSFIAGWMEWFASSVAGSLYAVTFALYTVHYFTQLGIIQATGFKLVLVEKGVAILIASFFVYINYRGASETGTMGAIFTLGQTVTLAFIALVGIGTAISDPSRLANFQPFLPNGWDKLLITMGFTYVAFEGFEVIAQAGDEAIDPRRNLPKAMIYSIVIVMFTYVGVAFASIVGVKDVGQPVWIWIGSYGGKGFGEAISRLIPSYGSILVTITVIFASTSALNATIYSATRASYALGRDRMLPAVLSRLHPKRRTPYMALLCTGGLVIVVAAFLPTIDVASSASMMFLFLFFLVNLCVIRIRRQMVDEMTYGFVMPLFPIPPIAAILTQAVLAVWLIHMSPIAWVVGPMWILSGLIIYHMYSKHRATRTEDEIVVIREEPIPTKGEYRILISVANPANAVALAMNCYRFCQAKGASTEVEVINMVSIPPQVPLSEASKYTQEGEEAITEAMLYLAPRYAFGSTIRYCRNFARCIISAAAERKADLLIMGWQGHRRRGFSLGSTVDPVLERATCNIAVFKDCRQRKYMNVLVPFAGGPNATFSLETASIMVDKDEGRVVVLHIAPPGKPTQDIDAFLDETVPQLNASRSLFEAKYVIARDRFKILLEEAEQHDLMVIGATRDPVFRQQVMGSLPEEVARHCKKPLIMVKAKHPIKSFIKRYI
ncbi:MAG: amino acid permease [Deltaproteobacteria bacterium]|jgi:amino acid transporter/nucleotide-binding universal stress UspA family protein|nr:amino acid permease [Deltaproteobacteria bacterium]